MTFHAFVCPRSQKRYGSFEVFHLDTPSDFLDPFNPDNTSPAGWYWERSAPGSISEGNPIGPFRSQGRAMADALKHG
mgnify:CR=1 FL=1